MDRTVKVFSFTVEGRTVQTRLMNVAVRNTSIEEALAIIEQSMHKVSIVEDTSRVLRLCVLPKRRHLLEIRDWFDINISAHYFTGNTQRLTGLLTFFSDLHADPRAKWLIANAKGIAGSIAIVARDEPFHLGDPLDDRVALARKLAEQLNEFAFDAENFWLMEASGNVIRPSAPTGARILQRLVSLFAVASAASFDKTDDSDVFEALFAFVESTESLPELEDPELNLVLNGSDDPTERFECAWRYEGAVVLAWACGLMPKPDPYSRIHFSEVSDALGWLDGELLERISQGSFVHPRDIRTYAAENLALMWRLRNQLVDPRHVDIVKYASSTPHGQTFDLSPYKLENGDIVIGGRTVSELEPERLQELYSITGERFWALRWLQDGGLYSETDLST